MREMVAKRSNCNRTGRRGIVINLPNFHGSGNKYEPIHNSTTLVSSSSNTICRRNRKDP